MKVQMLKMNRKKRKKIHKKRIKRKQEDFINDLKKIKENNNKNQIRIKEIMKKRNN